MSSWFRTLDAERTDDLGGRMSTPDDRWADRPEERLARDAGERPETLEDRADSAEQIEKDAGTDDVPGIHTDAPEQMAKDAGEVPEIIDRAVDVPEQIAKDAGDADRE
jgi:hypothetical protein